MYVYLLRSLAFPEQKYIGLTEDIDTRLKAHNSGKSTHTKKYMPWKLVASFKFDEKDTAVRFERYLKSGSGRSFANRHFW